MGLESNSAELKGLKMSDSDGVLVEKSDDVVEEMVRRGLKGLSFKQLEAIIAEALGKAVSKEYECSLLSIDFESHLGDSGTDDGTELKIVLKTVRDNSFFDFSSSED